MCCIGKALLKYAPTAAASLEKKLGELPKAKINLSFSDVKYYKGGFEAKMTRREAALVLGVR